MEEYQAAMYELLYMQHQRDEQMRRDMFNSIDMSVFSAHDLQYVDEADHRCLALYNQFCDESDDEDRMSPTKYLKTLIDARKMTEKQRQTPTLWRSRPTPDKNQSQCIDCENKAVQCICEDEWCLDMKNQCKAFKRHSECCGKVFARQFKESGCVKKQKQLKQSYSMKRKNSQVRKL